MLIAPIYVDNNLQKYLFVEIFKITHRQRGIKNSGIYCTHISKTVNISIMTMILILKARNYGYKF